MATIDERIQRALESLNVAQEREVPSDSYIGAFRSSAQSKAEAVLAAIKQAQPPLDKLRPIFLSIGGGDGEELCALLEQSDAKQGILVEKVKEFADIARQRDSRLLQGKHIEVFEGDAQRKLPEAIEFGTRKIKEDCGDFLAVSCHAVIHELHDRSDEDFDLASFLGNIFRHEEVAIWFTSREPGVPEKWPEEILLHANCRSESLLKLAEAIVGRHPAFAKLKPKAHIFGDNVRLNKTLAMEVIAKLFYIDDLKHEINERSTAMEHSKFQSMLMLAIGESSVKQQRANATTVSAATVSFQKNWQEFQIEAKGFNEGGGIFLLPVAESQTRVVAWRLPVNMAQAVIMPAVEHEPPPSAVRFERSDLSVAAEALASQDTAVLEALCVSRGRRWIESTDRISANHLLGQIGKSYPHNSLLGCWTHYLRSLASLFSNKGDLEMFSEDVEKNASSFGLARLFRAERMEFLRKVGGRKHSAEIVEIANSLLPALPESVLASATDLERYVIATTKFVIANLLRAGGLYRDAWETIVEAEGIYKRNVESHATELVHCHYAKTVCVALTGTANFDLQIAERTGRNRGFAFALIELAYAHAAWIVGDVQGAAQHANQAAKVFDEIDSPQYAKRARTLEWLLELWPGTAGLSAPPPKGSEELVACVGDLRKPKSDLSRLAAWLAEQRPSNALGLIQFAKDTENWTAPVQISVPPTLSWDPSGENQKLLWRKPENVASLSEFDIVLRGHLAIPSLRRIPLITD